MHTVKRFNPKTGMWMQILRSRRIIKAPPMISRPFKSRTLLQHGPRIVNRLPPLAMLNRHMRGPLIRRMVRLQPRPHMGLIGRSRPPLILPPVQDFDRRDQGYTGDRFEDFRKRVREGQERRDPLRDIDLIDDAFERRFPENSFPPEVQPQLTNIGTAGSFGHHGGFDDIFRHTDQTQWGHSIASSANSGFNGQNNVNFGARMSTHGFAQGIQGQQVQAQTNFPGAGSFPGGSGSTVGHHSAGSGHFKSHGGFGHGVVDQMHDQTSNIHKEIKQQAHLGHAVGSGLGGQLNGFDGTGGSDGFINDNIQSVAQMIPHAEPVFETNNHDGFLPETTDMHERRESKVEMFAERHNEMDSPIKGLELLGNSQWTDVINELASANPQGMGAPMDIPGEPLVVYPVNPHAPVEPGQLQIPGEGVMLVPDPVGGSGHPHTGGQFNMDTLDSRPSGLGFDAFSILGINPSTLDMSHSLIPRREMIQKAVTADKLAPEHPPPIPLPPRPKPETTVRTDAIITGTKLQTSIPVTVNVKTSSTQNMNAFAPFSVNDGFNALETFLLVEAAQKALDEV